MRALLGDRVSDVRAVKRRVSFDRFASGAEFRDYFKAFYGPTIATYEFIAEDPERVRALDGALAALGDEALAGGRDHRRGVPGRGGDPSTLMQDGGMTFEAAEDRYDTDHYRYAGRSGLKLPLLSLGLWQNFGTDRPEETQRAILRRAFDRGVTHFDLANNYGPPYGAPRRTSAATSPTTSGPTATRSSSPPRRATTCGRAPTAREAGSRKYVLASLDQSLRRMGLDYVDIFYSHRFDPETPIEETMMALDTAVRSGRALYAGISSYSAEKTG